MENGELDISAQQPSAFGESESRLILVAEDNDDIRAIMMEILRTAGYRVVGAARGDDVLQVAREQQPALILMDVGMPGMDGWTSTEQLKADPRTARIIVLIVTALTFHGDREIAAKVGSDGYLRKPISPLGLTNAVKQALAAATPSNA